MHCTHLLPTSSRLLLLLFAELQRARRELTAEKRRREKDKMVDDLLQEWSKILPDWQSR